MTDISLIVFITILGAFVGSFANVVALRLHTGKPILVGRSKCGSCGTELAWYHLVPILSFIFLRGRCGHCGSKVSVQYVLVELMFAILFGLTALKVAATLPLLILGLLIITIIGTIVLYDIRHTIIPDILVITLTVLAFVYAYVRDGFGDTLIITLITAFTMAAFFGGIWFVSSGKWMGLGDAKFVFGLALLAGFPGAITGFLLSFWLGALISVLLLVLFRKHRTISNEVPFAPYLALGFLCTYLFDIQLITLIAW